MARIGRGLDEERRAGEGAPPFHGFVLEGLSPYGIGSSSQQAALTIAAFSGMPVVRVGRADPGGMVPAGRWPYGISGSNLDTNKARMLLMASMLRLVGCRRQTTRATRRPPSERSSPRRSPSISGSSTDTDRRPGHSGSGALICQTYDV